MTFEAAQSCTKARSAPLREAQQDTLGAALPLAQTSQRCRNYTGWNPALSFCPSQALWNRQAASCTSVNGALSGQAGLNHLTCQGRQSPNCCSHKAIIAGASSKQEAQAHKLSNNLILSQSPCECCARCMVEQGLIEQHSLCASVAVENGLCSQA